MRRLIALLVFGMVTAVGAQPALACAALIGPRGSVNLVRTTTMAAYHGGFEHYVTSFEFAGGGGKFGSIVPLPGVPTKIEKGGDWTLQRLIRETAPQIEAGEGDRAVALSAAAPAKVIAEAKVDALELTVLEGGGTGVGDWARENGFLLPPDAPEVLDFYAERSPYFMAAKFDADAARAKGQTVGDGTPVHLTIPTDNPWVPLRILGLGHQPDERIEADVYLLTDDRPTILPAGTGGGLTVERQEAASRSLLSDLRSDEGMKWVPDSMVLTHLTLDSATADLTYDLAVDASGTGRPSSRDAGLPAAVVEPPGNGGGLHVGWYVAAGLAGGTVLLLVGAAIGTLAGRGSRR